MITIVLDAPNRSTGAVRPDQEQIHILAHHLKREARNRRVWTRMRGVLAIVN